MKLQPWCYRINDDIAKKGSKPFTDLLSLTFPTLTNQNQRLLPWYSWLPLPQSSTVIFVCADISLLYALINIQAAYVLNSSAVFTL